MTQPSKTVSRDFQEDKKCGDKYAGDKKVGEKKVGDKYVGDKKVGDEYADGKKLLQLMGLTWPHFPDLTIL